MTELFSARESTVTINRKANDLVKLSAGLPQAVSAELEHTGHHNRFNELGTTKSGTGSPDWHAC